MPFGPCCICGDTNYPSSLGGPFICPSCDCGIVPKKKELQTPQIFGDMNTAFTVPTRNRDTITDSERMDWLERNLLHIAHDRATCSVHMDGRCVHGQFENEARSSKGGSSYFRVNHRSIREAIDDAMEIS